ncbi:MAG: ABC transporter substrate-binding protein [Oscillospiraceae bacterium]|nr:ABC transporter substrate-binding protein [Oscillospiraceae bacterium]
MKKNVIMTALSAALIFLSGCSAEKAVEEPVYTFTDALGREVRVTSYEKTAVLSGSLAEIWQLAGGELYGVTSDAFDRPTLNLSKDVKNYGGVHSLSTENIIGDGVDFAIVSGTVADQSKITDVLDPAGVTTAVLDVENFNDYLSVLKIFTDITGREDLYVTNGENVREKVDEVLARSEGKESHTILLLRAYSSGVKARGSDNMTGEMLSQLGCVNIADSDSSILEELSLEAIVRANPEYVFVTTMGEDDEAAKAQYEAVLGSNQAWAEMDAVKNGKVYFLPKDTFHYKPNERWAEAYEYLEDILYE